MPSFCSWNSRYLKQCRGLLVISEVILSMITMTSVNVGCQSLPFTHPLFTTHGFYCKSQDTFLFVVSSSSFITSMLLFICCLLSKKTEANLHKTFFELSFYALYCVLLLMSSLILISDVIKRNRHLNEKEDGYSGILAGSVFGFLAAIAYGLSVVWFFLSPKATSEST